jgi:tRNA(Ile)-lysidine synthase
VSGWRIESAVVDRPATLDGANRFEAYLDIDAARARPTIRSRQRGDRLRPLGLGGQKKLQDVLVDAKVPARERDGVPLVCAEWGIG